MQCGCGQGFLGVATDAECVKEQRVFWPLVRELEPGREG